MEPANTDCRFALLRRVDASDVLTSRLLSVFRVAPSPSTMRSTTAVDSMPLLGVPVTQSFSVKYELWAM